MKKHLIVVIFAICALSYTFFLSRSISLDVHENILRLHSRLNYLESEIYEDMLKAYMGDLKHYDSLDALTLEAEQNVSELQTAYESALHRNIPLIHLDTQKLVEEITYRERLVEQFKSDNAILRDSLTYFTPLFERFNPTDLRMYDPEMVSAAEVEKSVFTLWSEINKLLISRDKEANSVIIQNEIDRLNSWVIERKASSFFSISQIVRHAEIIVRHSYSVDKLLNDYQTSTQKPMESELYNIYIEDFERTAQQSEKGRFFVYLASLALILSVLVILIKLHKTAKALREGNDSLESMVMQRTTQLVERNQQLSHQVEERKRAESQVLEEQSRMTAIFDIAINAIVTTDEAQTIIDFNPMAERTFGINAQQAIGHTLPSLLVASSSLETFQELIHRLDDEQTEAQVTTQMSHINIMGKRDKDGSFPMKVLASKNTVAESVLITLFIEDMTSSLHIERMKKEFTSIISHELRTPMTSIQGSLGLILGGALGKVPEDMESLLDIAYNNGERLVLLINDILDVEKFEAGEMAFDMDTISLTRLSLRAIEEMQGYASNFKVTLMFDAPAPDIFIRGDEARLLQVFSNLVSNAIKYSPEEGWVVVKLTLLNQDQINNKRVKVSIIDHGPGVPKAFHTTIFDKFSQADSSGSRSKGGTGLGLNIAKMLIEKHQGTIGFTSEQDVETVFFFDFPVLYTKKIEADLN